MDRVAVEGKNGVQRIEAKIAMPRTQAPCASADALEGAFRPLPI